MPPFPFVMPGDKIALVATAIPGSIADVDEVKRMIEQDYGVSVIYLDDAYSKLPPPDRAERLLQHVFNHDLALIWVWRGGEGSADLIPYIDVKREQIGRARPKMLVGLSDFTPILLYFAQQYGWPAVHGISASSFVTHHCDATTHNLTQQFLTGQAHDLIIDDLVPLNAAAACEGDIVAEACAANLSLVNISIKDCWELDTQNKIVILEDWQEKGFVVERTLKYFKRIGLFEQAKALILGDFLARPIGVDPAEQELQAQYMRHIQRRFASHCAFPVLQTGSIGHGRRCVPIPFCYPVRLHTGAQPTLSLTVR